MVAVVSCQTRHVQSVQAADAFADWWAVVVTAATPLCNLSLDQLAGDLTSAHRCQLLSSLRCCCCCCSFSLPLFMQTPILTTCTCAEEHAPQALQWWPLPSAGLPQGWPGGRCSIRIICQWRDCSLLAAAAWRQRCAAEAAQCVAQSFAVGSSHRQVGGIRCMLHVLLPQAPLTAGLMDVLCHCNSHFADRLLALSCQCLTHHSSA